MKKDPEHFFHELKNDVTTYAELRLELLKLDTYERMGKVISTLSYGLILAALALFLGLFIFVTLGFFLSDWLDSMGIGFSIVSFLYLLCIGGVALFKKQIQTQVLNSVISALTAHDKQSNATINETIYPTDSNPETES